MFVESFHLPKCKYTLKTIFPLPQNRLKNSPHKSLANYYFEEHSDTKQLLALWKAVDLPLLNMYWAQCFYYFRIAGTTPPF